MADNDTIQPYVRLLDLSTGAVVAATRRVLVGTEIVHDTNQPGTLAVSLSIAEQGEGPEAVADVLLDAVGGADGQQPLRPVLLEVSLGGALVDAAMQVRQITQDASKLQVTVSGPQIGILYGTRYLEKTPYPLVLLADALGAPAGTIPVIRTAANGTPIYGVLGMSGTYPFLSGIFQRVAGAATWAGRSLLKVTPVLDTSVAWQQVTERSYADTMLKALDLICQKLTSDVDSAVGHFVLESCSAALSLSARMAGIVTGGATRPSPQNPGKTSQQQGGVRNALVVGHVGATPYVTFDGSGTGATFDEAAGTAPLLTGRLTRTPDTSTQLAEVSMTGGSTRAGLPDGAKITRITCLHRTRAGWPHPAWGLANLPLISCYGSERVGGLYTTFEDGRFHPVGPAAGITDLAVDDLKGTIYLATDDGVYSHSTDVLATTEPWVRVGTLVGKVRRLQVVVLDVDGTGKLESYVWAHVAGTSKERDGLYRHDTRRGALDLTNPASGDRVHDTSSGIGSDGWSRMVPSDTVVDFCATDHHSVYYLDTHDLTMLHYYDFWPVPGGTNQPPAASQTTDIPLLGGASGTRLDRVTTVVAGGHPAQDSVWIGTKDDGAGLQVLIVSTSGVLVGTLAYGNADRSLQGPDGQPLIVQRCVGLGLAVDHEYLAILACTSLGLFVAGDLSGTAWKPVGEDGLAGYSITDVAAGQTQQLASTDGIQRFYAATENDLLISNSRGDWWDPLGEGSKVELSTYFVDLAKKVVGTYPDNDLVSLGPAPDRVVRGRLLHKSTAGIKDLTPLLAPSFAWQRRMDDEQGWVTWLVVSTSGSTNQSMEQVTEIQTDALISDSQAGQALAAITVRRMQEANEPITSLTLGSAFRTQGARLRRLKPTEQVAALYKGELRAFDSEGHVVSSTYLDLSKLRLYGLKHTLRLKNGGVVETETEVSTSLRTRRLSSSDWAASMMQRIKAVALQRV